jgi:CheY-like chemotaxis protein
MTTFDTLYLVDDDDTYKFIAQRTIESTGVIREIRTFSNGREAIDALQKALRTGEPWPDLIFLDISMPVLDGWGFLEDYELMERQKDKKINIFIVSSSINPVDVERARASANVTDYLVKPITADKFLGTLKELQ